MCLDVANQSIKKCPWHIKVCIQYDESLTNHVLLFKTTREEYVTVSSLGKLPRKPEHRAEMFGGIVAVITF